MRLFPRRNAQPQPEAPQSPFVECRSWYGVSFHLRDTRQEDGLALCGYEPLDDRSPVTREDVVAAIPRQHAGWRYCGECVDLFLGK